MKSEPMTNSELINIVNNLKTQRFSEHEKDWYEAYEAYQNNHFVVFNRQTGRLTYYTPTDQKFFIQIPKMTKQIRSFINLISNLKLIPYVSPEDTSQTAIVNAARLNKILEKLIDYWDFKTLQANILENALIYPYAAAEPVFDPETLIRFRDYDAFDIYMYPLTATSSSQVKILVKSLAKPVNDIKSNENYTENRNKIIPDNRISSSEIKDAMFRQDVASMNNITPDGTAMIYETYIKEVDKDGKTKVRIVTICQSLILRDEQTELSDFPIELLKLQSGKFMQKSFASFLLPLNRAQDMTFARIGDYFLQMVKGAYLVRAGSNVKRINDQNGEMIIYKGTPPTPLVQPTLPDISLDVMNILSSFIDDFGVSPISSGGKLPKGVRAGRMMQMLRESDVQNLRTPIDLYSAFLSNLFSKIVWLIANHLNDKFSFTSIGDNGEYETHELISEGQKELFTDMDGNCPAYVSSKMKVKVMVVNEDKVDNAAKLELLTELVTAKVVSPKALLTAAQMEITDELLVPEAKTTIMDSDDWAKLPKELQAQAIREIMKANTGAETLIDHPDYQRLSDDVKIMIAESLGVEVPIEEPSMEENISAEEDFEQSLPSAMMDEQDEQTSIPA